MSERQTSKIQVLVSIRACGFKSHLPHYCQRAESIDISRLLVLFLFERFLFTERILFVKNILLHILSGHFKLLSIAFADYYLLLQKQPIILY